MLRRRLGLPVRSAARARSRSRIRPPRIRRERLAPDGQRDRIRRWRPLARSISRSRISSPRVSRRSPRSSRGCSTMIAHACRARDRRASAWRSWGAQMARPPCARSRSNGRLAWLIGYSRGRIHAAARDKLPLPAIPRGARPRSDRDRPVVRGRLRRRGNRRVSHAPAAPPVRRRAPAVGDCSAHSRSASSGLPVSRNGPWMLCVAARPGGRERHLLAADQAAAQSRGITDSSRRAAVLSIESMARRAATGMFTPLVGLYGQADVMLLCGAVGIGGFVLSAVARVRRADGVAAGSAAQHASAPVDRR